MLYIAKKKKRNVNIYAAFFSVLADLLSRNDKTDMIIMSLVCLHATNKKKRT